MELLIGNLLPTLPVVIAVVVATYVCYQINKGD